MQFRTDTEIKKWKPTGNNTRVRCGPKLYIRGFETGRKLFQLRFEVERKTYWLDVADYPAMPLTMAREIAIASGRLIKAKDCTVESLRVALPKSDSAMLLEKRIKARDVEAQSKNSRRTVCQHSIQPIGLGTKCSLHLTDGTTLPANADQ